MSSRVATGMTFTAVMIGIVCCGPTRRLEPCGVNIRISGACFSWTITGPCDSEQHDGDACYANGQNFTLTISPLASTGGTATCAVSLVFDNGAFGRTETLQFNDCKVSPSEVDFDFADDAGSDAPLGWNSD